MDIWGRCEGCASWFSCPTVDTSQADWQCPACGADPVAIENRAAHLRRADDASIR